GLGQFALDDGQLAIAVLEDGVGAAEERKLHLLVLRAGVHLRGQFAELHFEFGEILFAGFKTLGEAGALHLGEAGLVLGLLLLRTKIKDSLLGVLHALGERSTFGLLFVERTGLFFERGTTSLGITAQSAHATVEFSERGAQPLPLMMTMGEREL